MTYSRQRRPGGFGSGGGVKIRFGGPLTPVLKYFIIFNVGIFIFTTFLKNPEQFKLFFGLVPARFFEDFALWQLVTFNFIHAGFMHLLFNMLVMYFFAGELEKKWGPRRFILFLTVCGIGSGISMLFTGIDTWVVGASGIVFGILLAFGVTYPERRVLLWFTLPIKVKWLVIIIGVVELIASVTSRNTGIAHLAHLGGMVFGGLFLYYDRVYMNVRQKYYDRKREELRSRFTIIGDDDDDDEPTYH